MRSALYLPILRRLAYVGRSSNQASSIVRLWSTLNGSSFPKEVALGQSLIKAGSTSLTKDVALVAVPVLSLDRPSHPKEVGLGWS